MAKTTFGGPQNPKWLLWKENRILIKWSVILMATYKTGDLLWSIKFVCMSEGKAFKNYLPLVFPSQFFFPNIILLNICVLWLKSEVFSLTEYKRKAKEREKHWCQFVCPDSDFWVEKFFFPEKDLVGMFLPSGWVTWYPSWDQSYGHTFKQNCARGKKVKSLGKILI